MATVTTSKIVVNLALNAGSTSSGGMITKNVKLGGTSQAIDTTAYNTDLAASRTKALALAAALAPILNNTVFAVNEITTAELS